MDHREYIRVIERSKVAVMMIHGIAGSPAHFADLLPIIPLDWSVYNILLDGHGKKVEDFGATSMKKWKDQVATRLNDIFSRHEQVVIIAHSMGTLFAIQAAIHYPKKVSRLFLLSVPFCPRVNFSTALTCLRTVWGNIQPHDKAAIAMQSDTSIQLDRRLWKYVTWIPRFLELLVEIRRVRRVLPQLAVSCQTFQSWTDELVSRRSCKALEGHPYISNTILYDSGHFGYGPKDMELLQSRLKDTFEELKLAMDKNENLQQE